MDIHKLAHIAVVGRPNVGKSTLFNALLGQRRAITAPESGVTRDVITEFTEFGGAKFRLSDTGGIREFGSNDEGSEIAWLYEKVRQHSLVLLEQADLLLWVIALGEWSAEDEQLKERLWPFRDKVILVVNKVDAVEKEAEAVNAYAQGFSELRMVSALHRRGLNALKTACIQHLPHPSQGPQCSQGSQEPKEEWEEAEPIEEREAENTSEGPENTEQDNTTEKWLRFSLMGRPNTGKSTLYNALLGTQKTQNSAAGKQKAQNRAGDLPALVSALPGTTRDVLTRQFFRNQGKDQQHYQIADTAGIRRKNKVFENVEYYSVNRAFKSLDNADIAVLLIDSSVGIQQQEKKIAQQILAHGCGLVFALNKIDLLGKEAKTEIRNLKAETRERFPHLHYAPICAVSARRAEGCAQLLRTIERVHEQLNRRISTGLLNQALQDWVYYYPPPGGGGRPFKIRYLTQVEVNPPRFVLFVNRTKGFPKSYLGFLQNQMRKELGFADVPLHLHLHE